MVCRCVAGSMLVMGLLWPAQARADLHSFSSITNHDPVHVAVGESQMRMSVVAIGRNQVSFRFYNHGPERSSLTDIYFDDAGGTLQELPAVKNGLGVAFTEGGSPADIPGARQGNQIFLAEFDQDSADPTGLGVNPGERLGITFQLADGTSFQDVLDDLAEGSLRIGIQVRGFRGAGSGESFVNRMAVAPLPSALLLGACGLALVGWARRRARP